MSLVTSSVEDIREVVLAEELDILLTGGAEAVEKIVDVGRVELVAVLEASRVVIDVVVLLNGLDNVALALHLEEFLGDHHVGIVNTNEEVAEVAIISVEVGRVAVGALIVGNGPLGSRHDAQVVVPVGVQGGDESVLGERALLNYMIQLRSVSMMRGNLLL